MHLEIFTPDKSLFEGEVSSILLNADDGLFELLNNHAPIISSIKEGRARLKVENGEVIFALKSGFVECLNNRVVILVEGGTKE